MKHLILLLFLGLSYSGFSQLTDTLEARRFWADNIHNIVTLNKSQILLQTHFPIEVDGKELTKKQFELSLNTYFNQELRDELSKQTIEDIDAWEYEDHVKSYILVCFIGEDFDNVVLSFIQVNGKWMLEQLDHHKEKG